MGMNWFRLRKFIVLMQRSGTPKYHKPIPGTDTLVPDTFPVEWVEGTLAVA